MKWLAGRNVRQLGWLCLLASSAPVVTFLLPLAVVRLSGCDGIDEAGVTQCIVLGINMTEPLTIMSLLTLLFAPAVVLAPIGVVIILANLIITKTRHG